MPAVMRLPGARLVAINDASPEADMDAMLDLEASRWGGRLIVLRNQFNLGFVKSANRGIKYDINTDVVLLNNDVIVPNRWLERLVKDIYALADAGTMTSMSNNTTISAFPNFMQENERPLALDLEQIDEAFRSYHLKPIEAPTGIGFCMYIRRSCLNDVGELDESAFGTGYGEENDFCQRALQKGWKSYISTNLYVYHRGGVSFGDQRTERILHAERVLDRRYPRYHASVQAFVLRDDLRIARLQRYFDLLRTSELPVVLHVSHGQGGGVIQHIQDLAKHSEGRTVSLVLRPEEGGRLVSIGAWDADSSMRITLTMQHGLELLPPLLKSIGISLVHFHHVMGWPLDFLSLGALLDVRQIFTCHDFYLISGNPTLTNKQGLFDPKAMDFAINPLYPLPQGMSTESWRQRYRSFLDNCACVIFPSHATYDIFRRYFDIRNPVLAYHPEPAIVYSQQPKPFIRKESYTIGVIGALSREKGADLVEAIAALAASKKLKFQFTLIGYAHRVLKHIKITGPYLNDQLGELITHEACDLILFPALWPETYSYTLSASLATGLPIIAPDIGAFPERLSGRTHTLLFRHPASGEALLSDIQLFLSKLEEESQTQAPVYKKELLTSEYYEEQYFRQLRIAKKSSDRVEIMKSLLSVLSVHTHVKRSGKERLLWALWPIYANPKLQILFRLIPHSFKRTFKRWLSHKPLHELTRHN
jgi:GT2 family glycosyltransferase